MALEIERTEHLGIEIESCHVWDHEWRRKSESWSRDIVEEESSAPGNAGRSEKSLRSSAKSVGWQSTGRMSQRSLMNRRKSNGPRTEPCKIPLRTDLGREKKLPSLTDWVLPESQEDIQERSLPEIP